MLRSPHSSQPQHLIQRLAELRTQFEISEAEIEAWLAAQPSFKLLEF